MVLVKSNLFRLFLGGNSGCFFSQDGKVLGRLIDFCLRWGVKVNSPGSFEKNEKSI